MGEAERGDAAPRLYVSYFCAHGHETRPAFAADAAIPDTLGLPAMRAAGQPRLAEPAAAAEDRAVQDPPGLRQGAAQRPGGRRHPDEALQALRARRARGEVIY